MAPSGNGACRTRVRGSSLQASTDSSASRSVALACSLSDRPVASLAMPFAHGGRPERWMAGAATSAAPATLTEPKAASATDASTARAAVVTGGATGLGRTIALEFGRIGCKVAFCWYEMDGREVEANALLTETTL